jgi:hypothetical protein
MFTGSLLLVQFGIVDAHGPTPPVRLWVSWVATKRKTPWKGRSEDAGLGKG